MTTKPNTPEVQPDARGPKVTIFDQSRVMHFRDKYNRIYERVVIGETSRSWLTGYARRPYKHAKIETRPATKAEYDEYIWVQRNSNKIAALLRCPERGYDVWSKIADLIGYVETPQEPRR